MAGLPDGPRLENKPFNGLAMTLGGVANRDGGVSRNSFFVFSALFFSIYNFNTQWEEKVFVNQTRKISNSRLVVCRGRFHTNKPKKINKLWPWVLPYLPAWAP